MPELDNSREPEQRDDGHDRWLAMQSAYTEYRRASEALECTRQSADDTNERLKLPGLEGLQWLAFERYLETRMEFLEARFDESLRPAAMAAVSSMSETKSSGTSSWLARFNFRPVLEILAAVLLCTMVFSLLREQRRVRDLEAARDELQATLSHTREGLRLLGQRVDAWAPPQHPGFQQVEHTLPAPAHRGPTVTPRAGGRKPSGGAQWRRQPGPRVPQKPVAAKGGVVLEFGAIPRWVSGQSSR